MAGVRVEAAARLVAREVEREHVEEGVADELDRHAGSLVERRLEGKDREHPAHPSGHLADAPLPPRPELGRDEVHHRHPGPARPAGEPQVELREVDQHERARALGAEPGPERAIGAIEGGDAADRLARADRGVRGRIHHHVHPGRAHVPAAHAHEPHPGLERA